MSKLTPKIEEAEVHALSPDARKILLAKRVNGSKPYTSWLKILGELEQFDTVIDLLLAESEKKFILFFILSFLLSYGTLFAIGNSASFGVFGKIGALALLISFLISLGLGVKHFSRNRKYQALNLVNYFRIFLIPFMKALRADILPDAKVNLLVDFSGPVERKITHKRKVPHHRFTSVIETEFLDKWCIFCAPLAGGAMLKVLVENLYLSVYRTWRNHRGKPKSKTKWKKSVNVRIALRPPSGDLKFGPLQDGLRLKEKPKGSWAEIKQSWKYKSVSQPPETTPPIKEILGMIFQLCSLIEAPLQKKEIA